MVANNINTFRLSQELYADYVPPSERVIPQNISMFFSNVTEEWNPNDLLVDSGPSKEFVYFSITCYILIGILLTITSAILIYGALKRLRMFLVPYMFSDVLFMCVTLFFNVFYFVSKDAEQDEELTKSIVQFFFSMAFQIYYFCCVLSLYQHFKETQSGVLPTRYPTQPPQHPSLALSYEQSKE